MLPNSAPLVVVGGGPAGYMAAINAAEAGVPSVLLLEATSAPLHKVLISGGGRCNVAHACWDNSLLVSQYPRGGRALLGLFSRFAAPETVAWFKARGLSLLQEADGRLFPASNRSTAVVDCLRQAAQAAGVQVALNQAVQSAWRCEQGGFSLKLRKGPELTADRLLLATGSHPSGHRIAADLGHGLVAPVPSLFSLAVQNHPLLGLAGMAMDPVRVELLTQGRSAARRRQLWQQTGALLVTHRGFSGPAILRLTAFAARELKQRHYQGELKVDWTGGRELKAIEAQFHSARQQQSRRQLANWRPWPSLSRRLWLHLMAGLGVDSGQRWAELDRRQQLGLITALRNSRYPIKGRGPFGEEFVTAGGIPLGEVNLATMESRLQPGLFLAGEVLDVDGVTGGFNFQHCWSSGWLAGRAMAI